MKLTRFAIAAVALLSSPGVLAHADTFHFSFGTTADTFSGSGLLTGDQVAPGEFQITGITGTTDTGNGVNRKIAGLEDKGGFQGNDNLLFVTNGVGLFDNSGLSYVLGNGAQINLFTALYGEADSFDAEVLERSGGAIKYQFAPYSVTAATPEPGSLVLLGTGMLGLVGAARRRFAA